MTERPLIFSGESVEAMLEDPPRKWMTRRVVDRERGLRVRLPEPVSSDLSEFFPKVTAEAGVHRAKMNPQGAVSVFVGGKTLGVKPGEFEWTAPYKVGGRLWVKETFGSLQADRPGVPDGRKPQPGDDIRYCADPGQEWQWRDGSLPWRPSMFMPRWASRIDLEVTTLRVEKLQQTTYQDAIAEGCADLHLYEDMSHKGIESTALEVFEERWDQLNAKRGFGWETNPLVWVIEFRRVRP